MPKRIIAINEMYSDNIGDQAISEAMSCFCKLNENVTVESADYSFRKGFVEKGDGVLNTKRRRFGWAKKMPTWLKKIGALLINAKYAYVISKKKYDLAVIGGGQLILSNSSFSVSMFLYVLFLRFYGTKIKIVSAGVGKQFGFIDKMLFSIALKLVDEIYLRDQQSINNLEKNFKVSASFSPDIVYFLHDDVCNEICASKKNNILICPVEYSVLSRYHNEVGVELLTSDEYFLEWVKVVKSFLDNAKYEKVYLAATTNNDFIFSALLYENLLLLNCKNVRLVQLTSLYDFNNLAKNCDAVVSGRMHALILGHNLGLDILPYQVSQKILAYQDEYLCYPAQHFKRTLLSMQNKIIS